MNLMRKILTLTMSGLVSQIMGSDAVPAFRGMTHFVHMAEVEVERYGNDLGLCSLLHDPWPPE